MTDTSRPLRTDAPSLDSRRGPSEAGIDRPHRCGRGVASAVQRNDLAAIERSYGRVAVALLSAFIGLQAGRDVHAGAYDEVGSTTSAALSAADVAYMLRRGALGANSQGVSSKASDASPPASTPPASPSTPAPLAPPPAQEGSQGTRAPKSLDELLGVPSAGSGDPSGESAAEREQERRLEKALSEASLGDLVERAVEGMRSATSRLAEARDPGIGTQRIQEDVVRTLERLLQEAERQSQSKSKSSSSRRSASRQNPSGDPSEPSGRQGAARQDRSRDSDGERRAGDNEGQTESDRPLEQGPADGVELDESRIEWGRLPERVRELVLQGRRDRVSTIYERLTREYYRRLAEEASK